MLTLLAALALGQSDGGAEGRVRLQAAVVVASTGSGRGVGKLLGPVEAKLRTLLPFTSYENFTEYTASLAPGEKLDLRLPDGRAVALTAGPLDAGSDGLEPKTRVARPVRVAVERGEEFESTAPCGNVTIFQVRGEPGPTVRRRTFLVYRETCPWEHPARLLPEAP